MNFWSVLHGLECLSLLGFVGPLLILRNNIVGGSATAGKGCGRSKVRPVERKPYKQMHTGLPPTFSKGLAMSKDGSGFGEGPGDFRNRFIRARALEPIAKDDGVMLDKLDLTVRRDHTVFKTIADEKPPIIKTQAEFEARVTSAMKEQIRQDVIKEVHAQALTGAPVGTEPMKIVSGILSDRGALLICYGALKVNPHSNAAVIETIEKHLDWLRK